MPREGWAWRRSSWARSWGHGCWPRRRPPTRRPCAWRGGAESAIDYCTEDLKARIKEITKEGADVVIDPVGGPSVEQALRALRWAGRFVTVGFASGEIPRIPLNLVLLKGIIVTGFTMEGFARNQAAEQARDVVELAALAEAGRAVPYISATYPLEEAGRALSDLADRRAMGKVLVDPTR